MGLLPIFEDDLEPRDTLVLAGDASGQGPVLK